MRIRVVMGLVVLAEIIVDVISSRKDDCITQVGFSSVAFLRALERLHGMNGDHEWLDSTRNLIGRNSAADQALKLNFVKWCHLWNWNVGRTYETNSLFPVWQFVSTPALPNIYYTVLLTKYLLRDVCIFLRLFWENTFPSIVMCTKYM